MDKYSVSEEEYLAFLNYVIIDDSISTECIEELAEYAGAARGMSIDVGMLIKGVWSFTDSAELLKLNRVLGIVWRLSIIWCA